MVELYIFCQIVLLGHFSLVTRVVIKPSAIDYMLHVYNKHFVYFFRLYWSCWDSSFNALRFQLCIFPFFFFWACKNWLFHGEQCIRALFTGPKILLFSNFFIKNGSHDTIYIFKNYFATVFSVSAKISSIQMDTLYDSLWREMFAILILY